MLCSSSRDSIISYQDYHMLLLSLTGDGQPIQDTVANANGSADQEPHGVAHRQPNVSSVQPKQHPQL